MALLAVHTEHRRLARAIGRAVGPAHEIAHSPTWSGLLRLVHRRPVTSVVVHFPALEAVHQRSAVDVLTPITELHRHFPTLGVVLLVTRNSDPSALFDLGKASLGEVVVLEMDDLKTAIHRAVQRSLRGGASRLVTWALQPYLPPAEGRAISLAMDGVHRRWSADEFAGALGLSRPFLSVRLKANGLPSVGQLLRWSRLLHAGHWLSEPGRSAESVARQLEYASGSAFRRALKGYTGATPTEVAREGGFRKVFQSFISVCELHR